MANYLAIELKNGERPHALVGEFTRLANQLNVKFKELETLGVTTFGSRPFLRCRIDSDRGYPLEELAAQVLAGGRGIALHKGQGYEVRLPGGRVGSVPGTTMQAAALPSQMVAYRGPRMKFWERQFS